MSADGAEGGSRKKRRLNPPETGPYVLRQLVDDVPVVAEDGEQAHISCVEYWNGNLYVGTSAGEVLHFVSLPPDTPVEQSTEPTFILASRLPIATTSDSPAPSHGGPGVQQILTVPSANKACILCNGAVTFYTLPELSPAHGTTKVGNCNWIGGFDLNEANNGDESKDPVLMVAMQNKLMLVRIGEKLGRVRTIEFPGCLVGARRDTIACVADAHSYSLLEVEHRQKIPLLPISTSGDVESDSDEDPPRAETPAGVGLMPPNPNTPAGRGHGRSASLNAIVSRPAERRSSLQPNVLERSGSATPESSAGPKTIRDDNSGDGKTASELKPPSDVSGDTSGSHPSLQKPLPPPPPPKPRSAKFKPHIVSPAPSEFLFITGAESLDPAVGMFVNLDGEGVRGPIEFHRYPDSIVVDNDYEEGQSTSTDEDQGGYILAVIKVDGDEKYIEAQRWDIDTGERERHKSSVPIPLEDLSSTSVGMLRTTSTSDVPFAEVGETMQMVRLKSTQLGSPHPSTPAEAPDPRTKTSIERVQKEKELFDGQESDSNFSERSSSLPLRRGWEAQRIQEEAKFAMNLGRVKSSTILWGGSTIWRVVRNPLALQLENRLGLAQSESDDSSQIKDQAQIIDLLNHLNTVVPKTESEYLGLRYVKQKASLLLFVDLISSMDGHTDRVKITEKSLVDGELDPRIILLLVPLVKNEVLQSPQGIWVNRGLATVLEPLINAADRPAEPELGDDVLRMLVRYLFSYQQKRGYASVQDEGYVFNSVDTALLHILLDLDSKDENASTSSLRAELNKLVDNWRGDFDRAIELLEKYKRLYVLSRLYQSRKMSKHVLQTWRRVAEGETDLGGELSVSAAEIQVRKYIVRIRDHHLVEEYGSWLAARNANLGIQVFADDNSRVKLQPEQVIRLLKNEAPGAVQVYLEHLVFAKHYSQYADDLIAHYLDTVISVLENNSEARTSLKESYSTYRALRAPKPSYLGFISENAPPEPWWQSRLRLLQLLGGETRSQYTATAAPKDLRYSISTVLSRIEPFQNELVSECIILGGRQGRHHESLHLLTHGLGDYDTAIRYCLFRPTTTDTDTPEATQKDLFTHLLREFLQITDPSDRIDRTSDLLTRFAPLFNVQDVLALVPEDWSVEILSGFLVRVLRDLVSETREAKVQRTLSAGLNLQVGVRLVEQAEKAGGGWVEDDGRVRVLNGVNDGGEVVGEDEEPHEQRGLTIEDVVEDDDMR